MRVELARPTTMRLAIVALGLILCVAGARLLFAERQDNSG